MGGSAKKVSPRGLNNQDPFMAAATIAGKACRGTPRLITEAVFLRVRRTRDSSVGQERLTEFSNSGAVQVKLVRLRPLAAG